jgi:hypothetical protein
MYVTFWNFSLRSNIPRYLGLWDTNSVNLQTCPRKTTINTKQFRLVFRPGRACLTTKRVASLLTKIWAVCQDCQDYVAIHRQCLIRLNRYVLIVRKTTIVSNKLCTKDKKSCQKKWPTTKPLQCSSAISQLFFFFLKEIFVVHRLFC